MARKQMADDEALDRVLAALSAGSNRNAVEIAERAGRGTPELRNAYGVALMRTGAAQRAVDVFRPICLDASGIGLRAKAAPEFVANFAAALALSGNVSGAEAILHDLNQDTHPAVRSVRDAIARWRNSMTWWDRLLFSLYGRQPKRAISFEQPAGSIPRRTPVRPAA